MPSPADLSGPGALVDSTSSPQPNTLSAQLVNGSSTTSHDGGKVTSDAQGLRTQSDAIREGKEKAKAVMAASGVDASSIAKNGSDQTLQEQDGPIANGQLQSRKRSRSGSRRPLPADRPPKDRLPIDTELGEYEFARIQERDNDYDAHVADQSEYINCFYKPTRDQLDHYKSLSPARKQNPAQVFGYGYAGFGNGTTNRPSVLLYPAQKLRLGHRRARTAHIKRKDMAHQADQLEELVPIRLDIELDKIKLRDSFTWNLHERATPTDVFAETLAEDFNIPPEQLHFVVQQVNQKIQEQVQDYYPHVFIEEEPLDPHLPYSAYKNDEMRVLIKVNITIGPDTLIDQFEWEINNPLNNPEEFARQMTKDLSLSGEFATAVAHQIREQSQMFTKSLYILGHPFDGRPIDDPDMRDQFLPSPLPSVFRPAQSAKEYTPYLFALSESELQREELSILREQRRQKRSVTRRGGPALPDLKDRERTVRSLVVSSVIPGAAESMLSARVLKISRSSGRVRRAGAGRTEGGDDSDESEEEESDVEMEVTQPQGGTARTRGMRGAASAAQAALRATVARSTTPDPVGTPHHHETRTSARKVGHDVREESVPEPTSLIVKLRIGKAKMRQWLERNRSGRSGLSTPQGGRSSMQASAMPPPPSPAPAPRSAPGSSSSHNNLSSDSQTAFTTLVVNGQEWKYDSEGRVDAPHPLAPGQASAPPPPWLTAALATLNTHYPQDSFEAQMIYRPVNKFDHKQVKADKLIPGEPLPAHVKYMWLPRIKCHDCPGKLYTAGPLHTVENFDIHLKNRGHKERVEQRIRDGQ